MQHLFSQVPTAKIPRSKFNRSHGLKTAFYPGKLVPIFIDEVLPADTFNLKASILVRMPALIAPLMDNLYIDTFFFYVPERLVYDKFQKMCGEQENPDDSTDYVFPTLKSPSNGFAANTLADFFGLPTASKQSNGKDEVIQGALTVRSEPFRAYWLIWNEWFRDENLQDSVSINKGESSSTNGVFTANDGRFGDGTTTLAPRGKRHDYFTSALPWPQKGPGVELPLTGNAPIMLSKGTNLDGNWVPTVTSRFEKNTLQFYTNGTASVGSVTLGSLNSSNTNNVALEADLSGVTAATINDLRQAFQIQKWYERAARGGTRYTEILLSFFGVKSPDARLQRPEYLGGTTQRIQITQVPQTSATDEKTPQANLAAFGLSGTKRHGFIKSFVEHGWIIGLMCVRSDLTYQQGINRMWLRCTKFDIYWPPFAHLGEQVVTNEEIYAQGTAADKEAFGYQERYAEYRYYPSMITGEMRSTYAQTLDFWHLAQKFDTLPQLNEEFIEENVPIERAVAVIDEPPFIADIWFDMNCVRPMPVYSVPGLVDHF
jgi:hypothetical protein